MLPSDISGEAALRDAALPAAPSTNACRLSSPVHLPHLGYKRCAACRQRRAIKGGSQKGGRFVCRSCLAA